MLRRHIAPWVKRNQNAIPLRQALDLAQAGYELVRRARPNDHRPAVAGGWPVRLVPFPPPQPFTRHERRELRRAASSQSTSFFDGASVRRFEAELAARWGSRHALALSSGTASLHTAMMACGIGPGDEVIVPALTYVATALAVMQAGAKPVFVDADPSNWNIDPHLLEAAITPRTKAVIPVHIGGVACGMTAILAIAAKHDLWVVEDAAHAHGSTWNGQSLGTIGDIGCFSFGSPKSITTGEGGALLTDDPELYRRARMAMNLGECTPEGQPSLDLIFFEPETRLDYVMVGWNYRMSTAQAAIGLGQLARFDAIRRARSTSGAYLREHLARIPGLKPQEVTPGCDPCYYTFPFEVQGDASLSRGELLAGLAAERVDYRLWSNKALPSYAVFGGAGDFPVADRLCRNGIGFRVDPRIGRPELEAMVFATRRLLGAGRPGAAGASR
ncbi:MAG: DegT/DnrJ/EryC1/StrS family aminotransferase [Planctomycetota bacterium]|nr:DegT/DnrJ/EryC1/StrS family aminotransferase [Planctomycetota bacterium]